MVDLRSPSDEQSAEAIVPATGAFDDPASGLTTVLPKHDRRLATLALLPNVRRDAPRSHSFVAVGEVVSLVETKMLGPAWPTRCTEHPGIERGREHPLVVHVGSTQHRGQRKADDTRILNLSTSERALTAMLRGDLAGLRSLCVEWLSVPESHDYGIIVAILRENRRNVGLPNRVASNTTRRHHGADARPSVARRCGLLWRTARWSGDAPRRAGDTRCDRAAGPAGDTRSRYSSATCSRCSTTISRAA